MNAGLYIHFPFCEKKCVYCDFYSIHKDPSLIDNYIKSLQQEIKLYTDFPIVKDFILQTIYIGGGTPSILSPPQIETILNVLFKKFKFVSNPEITIEINPETVDFQKLKFYKDLGINRLSIGVQSFNDIELKILGRIHNAASAISCIRIAQQVGFHNINIDLIFAIPEQSLKNWLLNLQKAIDFSPQHISVYGLTVEPQTPLAQKIQQGSLKTITESVQREMYLRGIEILEMNGFQQYEISNFAHEGFYSHHNQMYWDGFPYLGMGPSAHSFWNDRRQWNVSDVLQYIENLNRHTFPIQDTETLTTNQQELEFILLGLRKKTGINFDLFHKKFNINFKTKFNNELSQISSIHHGNLILLNDTNLRLTADGFLLYNEICSYFV